MAFGVCINVMLGLFVVLRNPKSATHVLFFLLSLDIAAWSIANYVAVSTTDLLAALYWTRIVMALAVPQAVLFFFLMATIPSRHLSLPNKLMIPLLVMGAIVMGACMSPYLFTSLIFVNNAPSPTPGPAMPLFVLVAVGSLVAGGITLWKRLHTATGVLRPQLQIIGLGIVCMFALILLFNFVLVVMFSISSYVSASPLYTLPFVLAVAYAIVKHKFLDIRAVIARAVSYSILMTLFGICYALIFALTSSLLVSPLVDPKFIGISTLAALTMLVTFPFVKRAVEKATDSLFFKDAYNTSEVLYRLTQILARTLRLEDLAHQFLKGVTTELHIDHACIILMNEGRVFTVFTQGYVIPPEVPEREAAMISTLGNIHLKDDEKDSQIIGFCAALDASVVMPLETSQRVIGILCLGSKLSGDRFSQKELSHFQILASEVAVAIENSLSYEEIRRFNTTLEAEVTHATDDLRQANEKLTQLDKLKDEFVSLASHELRTPLTSIRSYLWMALSGKGGVVPDKQKFYLDRAFSSADRLIRLVNDMLNISRIESGRLAVQFSRTDVPCMIKDVVSEVQPKIDEQGLTLHINTGERPLPDIIADVDKMKEVLINFIGNAIKFTPRGGTITITAVSVGEYVRIMVKDTGLGFDAGESEKLFQKFSTLNARGHVQSAQYQSTGLGLYISKSIVSLHGGEVSALSDGHNKGSTFSFTLPVYTPQKREELQRKYGTDGLGIIHNSVVQEKPV